PVAGAEGVDQRRFPGTGPRAGEDDDRPLGLKYGPAPGEDLLPERLEGRPAVVDGGEVHRPQHPVRNVGGSGNLEEMTSAANGHHCSLPPRATSRPRRESRTMDRARRTRQGAEGLRVAERRAANRPGGVRSTHLQLSPFACVYERLRRWPGPSRTA